MESWKIHNRIGMYRIRMVPYGFIWDPYRSVVKLLHLYRIRTVNYVCLHRIRTNTVISLYGIRILPYVRI